MSYIYPVIFYSEEDGPYSVIFPDLNEYDRTYSDKADKKF